MVKTNLIYEFNNEIHGLFENLDEERFTRLYYLYGNANQKRFENALKNIYHNESLELNDFYYIICYALKKSPPKQNLDWWAIHKIGNFSSFRSLSNSKYYFALNKGNHLSVASRCCRVLFVSMNKYEYGNPYELFDVQKNFDDGYYFPSRIPLKVPNGFEYLEVDYENGLNINFEDVYENIMTTGRVIPRGEIYEIISEKGIGKMIEQVVRAYKTKNVVFGFVKDYGVFGWHKRMMIISKSNIIEVFHV